MRKIISYFLLIIVVALYTVSTMGYAVHKCNKDNTLNVVLLYGEVSCESIHSHLDSEGNIYSHKHEHSSCGCSNHDDKCCNTKVYTVSSDQTIEHNISIVAPIGVDSFLVSYVFALVNNIYDSKQSLKIFYDSDEPLDDLVGLYILNCTFLV